MTYGYKLVLRLEVGVCVMLDIVIRLCATFINVSMAFIQKFSFVFHSLGSVMGSQPHLIALISTTKIDI